MIDQPSTGDTSWHLSSNHVHPTNSKKLRTDNVCSIIIQTLKCYDFLNAFCHWSDNPIQSSWQSGRWFAWLIEAMSSHFLGFLGLYHLCAHLFCKQTQQKSQLFCQLVRSSYICQLTDLFSNICQIPTKYIEIPFMSYQLLYDVIRFRCFIEIRSNTCWWAGTNKPYWRWKTCMYVYIYIYIYTCNYMYLCVHINWNWEWGTIYAWRVKYLPPPHKEISNIIRYQHIIYK